MEGANEVTPAFWGLFVLGFATVYNYTPNTASGIYSPHYHLTGKHPDLSETCKFPFGQLVTVAKTNQEMRGMFKFSTKNDIGLAVGSVTYNNKSTFVYIPSHTGSKMVFPRINVRAINSPPKEWVQDRATPEDTTLISSYPLAVIDPSDGVLVTRLSNNIDIESLASNEITDPLLQQPHLDTSTIFDDDVVVDPVPVDSDNLNQSNETETNVNDEESKDQGELPNPQPRSPIGMLTHPNFNDDAITPGEATSQHLSHTGRPRSLSACCNILL